MTKISNQRAYIPDEEINGLDYLPGTDFDQALKTVNFRVQDLGTHYNQVNGVRNFDYNFYAHSGSNPKPADGYFYSNSNEQDPNNITYFIFSKKTARFKDTTNFFESIATENPFDLIIAQKVDINTIFFFRIDSIETFSGYYKLNVSEVFFPNGKELSYTLSYTVFNLKNEALGPIPTKTSDLTNDGSDGTSTYVETDELGVTAFSNDYNDLDNKPTIPTVITNHSGLSLDDGTNPHGTTKQDVGLGDVPNLDTTNAVNNEHTHSNKTILDNTTESFITALKNAYNGAVSWITTNGTNLINHLNNISNPHNVTKSQVGLGSVDNTSDVDKPISTATQVALNLKLDKVSTAGVERAYIINADGSQGTKATSDFKDVIEVANLAALPATGETGKIYLALDTNKTYRWSGSAYVQIGGGSERKYFETLGNRYTLGTINAFYSSTVENGLVSDNINAGVSTTLTLSMATKWVTPLLITDKICKLKNFKFRASDNLGGFTQLRIIFFIGQSVNGKTVRINNQVIHDETITMASIGQINFFERNTFTNDITIPKGYDLCYLISRLDGTGANLYNVKISGYVD